MAKVLTADELRTQPEDELVTKLKEAKEELFNLRFQAATGQLESHGRLRAVKREIARIYTVMRERELGIISLVEEAAPEVEVPETPETSDEKASEASEEKASEKASEEKASEEASEVEAPKAPKKAAKESPEDSAEENDG